MKTLKPGSAKRIVSSLLLVACSSGAAIPVALSQEKQSKTDTVIRTDDSEPATDEAAEESSEPKRDGPQIEVCFVLDTTGSMASLIQGAKDKIWSIANEMLAAESTPQIRFALIGYRDRGDEYVTRITDLTDDIDAIHTQLMAFGAKGGNDTPESVNQALNEAVNRISWSEDSDMLKIIFLVGDAPPHMDYDDDIHYTETCKLAIEKHLIINTIQCGNMASTKEFWHKISNQAEGSYVQILQSGGTTPIATPFDREIAEVNVFLNRTVCGYGDSQTQQSVREKISSNEMSKAESIADRANYFSVLRGAGATSSRWQCIGGAEDLVEKLASGKMKYADVEVEKLPEELRKLDDTEREAKLMELVKQRKESIAKLDKLSKQRADFIQEQKLSKKLPTDSFDENVKAIIRKQAGELGIDY